MGQAAKFPRSGRRPKTLAPRAKKEAQGRWIERHEQEEREREKRERVEKNAAISKATAGLRGTDESEEESAMPTDADNMAGEAHVVDDAAAQDVKRRRIDGTGAAE